MRVAIADDSYLFRQGLAGLLTDVGIDVAGTVDSPDTLLPLVLKLAPDVVLIDLRFPPRFLEEGLDAALQIKQRSPRTGTLVLSTYAEISGARRLLEGDTRGVGYLLKDRVRDIGELREAIERVAVGGVAVDPELVQDLVRHQAAPRGRLSALGRQQIDVLELVARGMSNRSIADRLCVVERTVENHLTTIFRKLDLSPDENRRVSAVLAYLESGPSARKE